MPAAQLGAVVVGSVVAVASGARMVGYGDGYDEFRRTHRSDIQQADTVGWDERHELFRNQRSAIEEHNNGQRKSWTEAINKFADYTDAEKQRLLGYRRFNHGQADAAPVSSFLEESTKVTRKALSEAMDWGLKDLKSSSFFRNQGACGSCWAVAAVAAIEMHAEVQHGNASKFSAEQIIDCTPNPQHCGGTGGCHGSTAELAFEYVKSKGIALDADYPIDSLDDQCFDSNSKMTAKVDEWIRLPENEVSPLLETIATKGPVVVSVDASPWFAYNGGVFAGCSKDAIVNHAVLLTGYGVDDQTGEKYWRIRNSWGEEWGEGGHIRLLRHENDNDFCGTDSNPKAGVACDGGPESLPVCGMCGVLSDTSYPSEVSFNSA